MNPIWEAVKEFLALLRELLSRGAEAKREKQADEKANREAVDARRNDAWRDNDPGGMFNG